MKGKYQHEKCYECGCINTRHNPVYRCLCSRCRDLLGVVELGSEV